MEIKIKVLYPKELGGWDGYVYFPIEESSYYEPTLLAIHVAGQAKAQKGCKLKSHDFMTVLADKGESEQTLKPDFVAQRITEAEYQELILTEPKREQPRRRQRPRVAKRGTRLDEPAREELTEETRKFQDTPYGELWGSSPLDHQKKK